MKPSNAAIATLLHSETLSRSERRAAGDSLRVRELVRLARELGITGYSGLNKRDLIERVLDTIEEARQIRHHWRGKHGNMAFDEAWKLASELAKVVAPDFDVSPGGEVLWHIPAGTEGASSSWALVEHGDHGWSLSKASWGEGPAEIREVEAWTFVPRGLGEDIALTLTVTWDSYISRAEGVIELSLSVIHQPRLVPVVERLRERFEAAVS